MINLELTIDEVNLVLAGLGELPAKTSIELIHKIQAQGTSQLKMKDEGKGDEQR